MASLAKPRRLADRAKRDPPAGAPLARPPAQRHFVFRTLMGKLSRAARFPPTTARLRFGPDSKPMAPSPAIGFHAAKGLPIHEKGVVRFTGGEGKFANGNTRAGSKVDFVLGLNSPA